MMHQKYAPGEFTIITTGGDDPVVSADGSSEVQKSIQ